MFAAIGSDRTKLVVWGLGETRDTAEDDARRQYGSGNVEFEIVKCTTRAARLIEAGQIAIEGEGASLILVAANHGGQYTPTRLLRVRANVAGTT